MTAKVKDYFDANWHNIPSEWVHGLKGFNLSNNTTNRIESFFSHVKSVICRRAPLKDMIQNFLQILQTLSTERYYRMVKKYNKRNINTEIPPVRCINYFRLSNNIRTIMKNYVRS